MVLKKSYPTLEKTDSLDVERLDGLPSDMLKDIDRFVRKNSLVKSGGKHVCCENCLKAYVVKLGEEFNLGAREKNLLTKKLKCEVGHGGYYLDGDKLRKV